MCSSVILGDEWALVQSVELEHFVLFLWEVEDPPGMPHGQHCSGDDFCSPDSCTPLQPPPWRVLGAS